jgi:pimeloyl-ACP methyl ester carboxylesterase
VELIPKYYNELIKKEREEIFIKSFDNIKLQAYLYETHNPVATIILIHGHASFGLHDFSPVFDKYSSYGFNILIISLRGHYKSGGKFFTYGIKESNDLQKWCEYLSNRFVGLPIRISGISLGASVSMYASSLDLPNVISIVSDCGFTSPKEEFLNVMKTKFHINGGFIIFGVGVLAKLFLHINISFSKIECVSKSKYPILFIHGLSDDYVPFKMGEANYNACSSYKMAKFVPNAIHAGAYFEDKEGIEEILDEFFLNTKK